MPERTVDLRSDTVTLPTPEMKQAMMEAALGDDGYGEDATVNRLQELAAEKRGILANPRPPAGARLVVHRHITHDDVTYVVDATRQLVERG